MSARGYLTHPLFSKAVKVLASVQNGAQWCVAMNFVEAASRAYAFEMTGEPARLFWPMFVSDVCRAARRLNQEHA